MSLSNFKSKQPASELLKEGRHRVHLVSAFEADSFSKIKGGKVVGKKDNLPEWCNAIAVICILVANIAGSLFYRLHQSGCLRYSELNDAQLQSGKYVDVEGFACIKTANGLERVEDPDRTAVCERIIGHFIWALGQEEGIDGQTAVDRAIANKTEFDIDVVKEPWTDEESGEVNDQYRIARFVRISPDEPVEKKKFHDLEA